MVHHRTRKPAVVADRLDTLTPSLAAAAAPPVAAASAAPPTAPPPPPASSKPKAPRPTRDANGHDPDAYEWVPVLRRPRTDGWTPAKQRAFIEELADTACVSLAAQAVAMSASSAYRLRRAPDGAAFAAAWDAALDQGAHVLVAAAFERALQGSEEPVFDREGRRVGRRFRQNDRLMMFLLRKLLPERFGDAGRDSPAAGAIRASGGAPRIANTLATLEPVPPADPAALMGPKALKVALEIADLNKGELPHRLRAAHSGDSDPELREGPGPEFEAALEAAKREADPLGYAAWERLQAELDAEQDDLDVNLRELPDKPHWRSRRSRRDLS